MTAALAHWAEYRGRPTGDKKRRMEAVMLKAFVDATRWRKSPRTLQHADVVGGRTGGVSAALRL